MRRRVLVKCGDSQKPVQIQPPWRKHKLASVVLDKFNLPPTIPILLQIYDQDWETYIDLEDDVDIPDRSKINCIVRPNIYSHDTAMQPRPALVTGGLPSGAHTPDAPNPRKSYLESSLSETSIRLPTQRLDATQIDCSTYDGQERHGYSPPNACEFTTKVRGTRRDDKEAHTRSSVRQDQQAFFTGNGASKPISESEDMNKPTLHTQQLTEPAQCDNKRVYIDLAEEELIPVSGDESNQDDFECVPEVHFQTSWPSPYILPSDIFPQKLTSALENQEQLDWSLRHILVQCIADSILKYTTYPSQYQKDEVISALFERYPYLAKSGANGSKRWHHILNEKFKNVRRKMTTPEVVSRKRKRTDLEQVLSGSNMNENIDVDLDSNIKHSDEDSLEMCVYEEEEPYVSGASQHVTDDVILQADDSYETFQPEQHVQMSQEASSQQNIDNKNGIMVSQYEQSPNDDTVLCWPTPYILPKRLFPTLLVNALENKLKLDGPKANLLIRCLSDSILPYTVFPTVKQREEVVKCLVREYPHLIDNSPTGWTNHYIKLSERFKNIRRKLARSRRESGTAYPPFPPSPSQDSTTSTTVCMDTRSIKIEVP